MASLKVLGWMSAACLSVAAASGQGLAASWPVPDSLVQRRVEAAWQRLEMAGLKIVPSSDANGIRSLAEILARWVATAGEVTDAPPKSCLEDLAVTPAATQLASIQELLPGRANRFWRSLNFSLELKDLPDKFLVEDTDGNIATVINTESLNPTFKFTVKPGDFVLSSADLALALTVFNEQSALLDASVQFEPEQRTFRSFARSLGTGHRLLNSLTLGGSISERPKFKSDGTPIAPQYLGQDRTTTTWSLKFDPYLYFHPLAARGSSYDAALSYGKAFGLAEVGQGPDPCDPFALMMASPSSSISKLCLAALTPPSSAHALFLPAIEVKSEDQFDFVQVKNQYLPATEDTLETYSLTWDLSRILSLAASRRTALAMVKAHQNLRTSGPTIRQVADGKEPQEIVIRKGAFVHRQLEVDGGLPAVAWHIETPQGKKRSCALPGLQFSGDGVLAGVPEQPGEFELTVIASDSLKREARLPLKVRVLKGVEMNIRETLMAKYLELAVRPEVVADDLWFEELFRTWDAIGGGAIPPSGVKTAATGN